uniref:PH domain-containing protein n=1 Tax=Sciurus vulgaris TaxID=55149 RepID=A0A8D2AY10_SCIVU
MAGWLFKMANYIKGYQRRWFVLSNGLLSYYRSKAEMRHTCRGSSGKDQCCSGKGDMSDEDDENEFC